MAESTPTSPDKQALQELLRRRILITGLVPTVIFFAILVAVSLYSVMTISRISQDDLVHQAEEQLAQMATLKAENLTECLAAVRKQAELLQSEGTRLIRHPEGFSLPVSPPELSVSSKGQLYKSKDNGGASAVYFSSRGIDKAGRDFMARSEMLDPLLARIEQSDPNIALTYFMANDTLVRMYPWQEGLQDKVDPTMDVSRVMVYYQADRKHNPSGQPNWTNVYLDHIGYGWMVTCTSPLYDAEEKLRGVVGIDLTVRHFEEYLGSTPTYIHPLLIDRNKNIIHATEDMEACFGLSALKERLAPGHITEEFIFPDEFNLLKNPNTDLALQMKAVLEEPEKVHRVHISGKTHLVAVGQIKEAGWTLLMSGNEATLLAAQHAVRKRSSQAVVLTLAVFGIFLLFFIRHLLWQARTLGRSIAAPINALDGAVVAAADLKALPALEGSGISEFDRLGERFHAMNQELREHREHLERNVAERTEQLEEANEQLRGALIETEQTQQALIRAERLAAVGTLAGGVAHEFNNINTSVLGFTELALSELPDLPEVRTYLDRVMRSALRARSITTNLLTFSGSLDGSMCMNNLVGVVHDTVPLVQDKFATDGITFDLHLDPVPDIRMDPTQIGQIILNLLINAQHALIDQPERIITITTGVGYDKAWVSVRDSGCGLTPNELPRIFSPFFSTKGEHAQSESVQSQVRGTGLGLSVSLTIAQNHGGTLEVESAPGQGSCFVLSLPRHVSGTPTAKADEATTQPATPRAEDDQCVLILDDEQDVCDLISIALRKAGYATVATKDGAEALDICHSQEIDLILLDMQMPVISGYEFLQRLNAQPGPTPRCLVISGLQTSEIAEKLKDLNITDWVAKPFTPDEIVRKVHEAIAR